MNTLTIFHGSSSPIRARGKHVVRLIEFAMKYPGWHTHATDRTTKRAIASGVRLGCIETREGNGFRFVFP